MATVSLKKLTKRYGTMAVVHGIDLEVADREFIALVGPSGCGKSTTLRMIAGLEEISDGEIEIGGRMVNDLPPRARNISMVFQSYALYPHMTVRENMGFSLKIANRPKEEWTRRVAEAPPSSVSTTLLERRPAQLSGGQRQRVAMGRAIVRDPDVFLFDEPLSNLDAKLRTQMRTEIKKLHAKVRSTVIYVTHDQVEAMTLADRIVIMRDGFIEQVGTPDEVFRPPGDPLRRGLHRLAADEPAEATVDDGRLAFASGADAAAAEPVRGRCRGRAQGGVRAQARRHLPDRSRHSFRRGGRRPPDGAAGHHRRAARQRDTGVRRFAGGDWVSRMLNPKPLKPGEKFTMSFDLSQAHLFDAATGKT